MHQQHFDFKQFSIQQDRCSMKVGTDGVLLGAWAEVDANHREAEECRILDIGAGTGLISLMLAQRYQMAFIDAVEIEPKAAAQCHENFDASPWADRLTLIPYSLKEAAKTMDHDCRYDLIVSNPPFYNATLKPEDEGRAVARHKDSLPMTEIAGFAHQHLADDGQLALIYPLNYDSEVMKACLHYQLFPSRICDVLTKVGKTCKRRMTTFARQKTISPTNEMLAIRDQQNQYTSAYLKLVDAFYLHLA